MPMKKNDKVLKLKEIREELKKNNLSVYDLFFLEETETKVSISSYLGAKSPRL